MRANLTDSDIRTLIKGPTEGERAHSAHKICRCIAEIELTEEERTHAATITAFRILRMAFIPPDVSLRPRVKPRVARRSRRYRAFYIIPRPTR